MIYSKLERPKLQKKQLLKDEKIWASIGQASNESFEYYHKVVIPRALILTI